MTTKEKKAILLFALILTISVVITHFYPEPKSILFDIGTVVASIIALIFYYTKNEKNKANK